MDPEGFCSTDLCKSESQCFSYQHHIYVSIYETKAVHTVIFF